jgi:hypothetical protein
MEYATQVLFLDSKLKSSLILNSVSALLISLKMSGALFLRFDII